MKRTSTYKDGHAPINLTHALCIITLLIDGARKVISLTNRLHTLANNQRNHIRELREILEDLSGSALTCHVEKISDAITRFDDATLHLPNPNGNTPNNRIANDFALEIDRITDILHDNTGYKWIDRNE